VFQQQSHSLGEAYDAIMDESGLGYLIIFIYIIPDSFRKKNKKSFAWYNGKMSIILRESLALLSWKFRLGDGG
jgi:hypothetical protein